MTALTPDRLAHARALVTAEVEYAAPHGEALQTWRWLLAHLDALLRLQENR